MIDKIGELTNKQISLLLFTAEAGRRMMILDGFYRIVISKRSIYQQNLRLLIEMALSMLKKRG